MSSTTRIVAQLAPQRSTQYSNLARDLAEVLLTKMRAMSKMQGDHGTAAEMDRLLDQAAQSGRMALAA